MSDHLDGGPPGQRSGGTSAVDPWRHPGQPAPLTPGFDRLGVIVRPHPGHCLISRNPRHHRQHGHRGTGTADARPTGSSTRSRAARACASRNTSRARSSLAGSRKSGHRSHSNSPGRSVGQRPRSATESWGRGAAPRARPQPRTRRPSGSSTTPDRLSGHTSGSAADSSSDPEGFTPPFSLGKPGQSWLVHRAPASRAVDPSAQHPISRARNHSWLGRTNRGLPPRCARLSS